MSNSLRLSLGLVEQFDRDVAAARQAGVLPFFLDRTGAYLAARRQVERLLPWLDGLYRSVGADEVTPADVELLARHAERLEFLADTLEVIARRRARNRQRRRARRSDGAAKEPRTKKTSETIAPPEGIAGALDSTRSG